MNSETTTSGDLKMHASETKSAREGKETVIIYDPTVQSAFLSNMDTILDAHPS